MSDSISIEIYDRCPAGLEIFQNERFLSINFTPSGGVGDCEVVNGEREVIALVQKHLSTISLLENTSRSEVLTVETASNDVSDVIPSEVILMMKNSMPISCPPSEEVAAVINVRVGLLQPNTLETVSRGRFKDSHAMNFRWELCETGSNKIPTASGSTGEIEENNEFAVAACNYRIMNHDSVPVAEVCLRRNSCRAIVRFEGEQLLSPVQTAVIFGGLSFLVLSMKKQRSLVRLCTLLAVLALIIAILVLVSVGVP